MGTIIEIDEIDKILSILIRDARARLKDIAKDCGISSVSVLKRIKRLKTLGVITGANLFPRIDLLGFEIVATIGIEADANQDQRSMYFNYNEGKHVSAALPVVKQPNPSPINSILV